MTNVIVRRGFDDGNFEFSLDGCDEVFLKLAGNYWIREHLFSTQHELFNLILNFIAILLKNFRIVWATFQTL